MSNDRPAGLTPVRPPVENIIWLDFHTGDGVDSAGQPIKSVLQGRRKHPNLHDLLETARFARADRIMLCGDHMPTGHDWLLPTEKQIARGTDLTPGWSEAGHYLADPARGRFTHNETKHRVTITTTAEWFGDRRLAPAVAKESYDILVRAVDWAIDRSGWGLNTSPAATGMNLFKLSLDKKRSALMLKPTPRDIGELIQATEPQHRVEHYVSGPGHCDCGDCIPLISGDHDIDGFAYADGRFMYAGVVRTDFGTGPITMLTAQQAHEQFFGGPLISQGFPQGAFQHGRYRIRYRIPEMWDHLGFFPKKHDDVGRGWHWPNRPGYEGETWANAVEIRTAILEGGWEIELLEGMTFTSNNILGPYRTYIEKILDVLDVGLEKKAFSQQAHACATSAAKHMFRVTIGSFSRRARNTTRFAPNEAAVPPTAVGRVRPAANGGLIYQIPSPSRPDDDATWHPEVAAQVWGEARTRVLRYKHPHDTHTYGALQIEPNELIGIQGDAIYTTRIQDWTKPVEQGGIDDGKNGRIRVKGYLPGPMPAPLTLRQRHELSHEAEEAGWR